jgi:hypothetical protein
MLKCGTIWLLKISQTEPLGFGTKRYLTEGLCSDWFNIILLNCVFFDVSVRECGQGT